MALKVDLREWNEMFGNVEREREREKASFWIIYKFLRVWKKREFYVIKRNWGRIKLLLIWRGQLLWKRWVEGRNRGIGIKKGWKVHEVLPSNGQLK